jgi:hypothetical protein
MKKHRKLIDKIYRTKNWMNSLEKSNRYFFKINHHCIYGKTDYNLSIPPYLFERVVFLIIAVISITGCATKVIIDKYPSTEKALFVLANAVPENEVLSGGAQIELVTPDGYYPARAVLFIKKPSYVRLELIPPVGLPDFYLAANPEEMKILIPSKGEFYQGKTTGSNLSRFLPVQLYIKDVVAVLTCSPHLTGKVDYLRYVDKNYLQIKMKNQNGVSETVWIRPDGRLEKLEHFDSGGKMLYRAEFSDYAQGSFIAGKIAISKDRLTSTIIKYSDVKFEKMNDMSIFDLSVPPGFDKKLLD